MSDTRKIAAILVADVVGYSRLAGADEERILARLRTLRSDLIDPTIAVYNGRIVKRTGDGSLIEFRSVVDAVRCAIEVQSAMLERNAGVPEDRRIEFRIGIHLGDVVEESDGDLMGDGVNIASRLEGIARPGAICLSEDAYRQVKARLDLAATDLGATQLKNIVEPIRIYALEIGVAHAADGRVQAPSPPPSQASTPPQPPSPYHLPEKPSIAVLAFDNMSGDGEQTYFSDGISEDIITDLSRLSELHVIARNSSFVYKNAAVSVPEIAKALGVRYVLEGSVRKAGNRVRVTAQLVDANDGGHVWANRFDRDLTDIFAVQDELTREIVTALKVQLTGGDKGPLAGGRPVDVKAYELLLRGREQASVHTRLANAAGRNLAEAAVAIEPDYAAAHALIAFTRVLDYINDWSAEPEQSLRTGRALAERAVAMAPDQPEGHFALSIACMWMRELDRAQDEAHLGLALAPNSVQLHMALAHAQIFSGDPKAALAELDISMRLDPLYPELLLQFLADAHFSLGAYETAILAIEARLMRNPQSETAYALLASCHGHLGHHERSRQAWTRALDLNPNFSIPRRRRILPFRNPEDFERRVEGLRKAGLVE
ncbi:TolB-like protein/class 3 adenylate cyclase/Flp pilus assembly protein TadD [Ensifer adhaerens]|uniref:TolB-like protein/class 3 adenylate cyclase/Flp pilus assembly protein TadD n=1 Tax=Ensifer adhaerens TaxID=106592 RepID=A0ACC5SZU9_ENSAD|nr:adenylate/guanylate cyclase domain-containing protein [Ensifer adhaerens]MBP1873929.1 TolB-like protein/class 3 adenylate cyclase/Flp pilus assembly protein TadD [Ensifer adhaerens]